MAWPVKPADIVATARTMGNTREMGSGSSRTGTRVKPTSIASGMIIVSSICSPWRQMSFDSSLVCEASSAPVGARFGEGVKVPAGKRPVIRFMPLAVPVAPVVSPLTSVPHFSAGDVEEHVLEAASRLAQLRDQGAALGAPCRDGGDRLRGRGAGHAVL